VRTQDGVRKGVHLDPALVVKIQVQKVAAVRNCMDLGQLLHLEPLTHLEDFSSAGESSQRVHDGGETANVTVTEECKRV
jgi:hypothetical protein